MAECSESEYLAGHRRLLSLRNIVPIVHLDSFAISSAPPFKYGVRSSRCRASVFFLKVKSRRAEWKSRDHFDGSNKERNVQVEVHNENLRVKCPVKYYFQKAAFSQYKAFTDDAVKPFIHKQDTIMLIDANYWSNEGSCIMTCKNFSSMEVTHYCASTIKSSNTALRPVTTPEKLHQQRKV